MAHNKHTVKCLQSSSSSLSSSSFVFLQLIIMNCMPNKSYSPWFKARFFAHCHSACWNWVAFSAQFSLEEILYTKSNYNQKTVQIECNQIKGNQLIILTFMAFNSGCLIYIYLHNGEILPIRPNNRVNLLVLTTPITLFVFASF